MSEIIETLERWHRDASVDGRVDTFYSDVVKHIKELELALANERDAKTSLEAKLAEAEKDYKNADADFWRMRHYAEKTNEKLKIAVEALELIRTYKGPEYYKHGIGSIFDVVRQALAKIKGEG